MVSEYARHIKFFKRNAFAFSYCEIRAEYGKNHQSHFKTAPLLDFILFYGLRVKPAMTVGCSKSNYHLYYNYNIFGFYGFIIDLFIFLW